MRQLIGGFLKKTINELMYKTETELQMQKINLWLLEGKRDDG